MLHRAYVLLGSNHEPEANLKEAIAALQEDVRVEAISPVYETAPVGQENPAAAPYLNAASLIKTRLPPELFKVEVLQPVEIMLGRRRGPGQPVMIDLDLMLWDDAILDFGAKPWHVPHPDVIRYLHAARPLADLAPDYVHPEDGRTLAAIAAALAIGLPESALRPRRDLYLRG
jgi:2-amino-4-hydroxy-6-hydroxymethyldihydropteridine diphosphokinase